MFITYFSHNIKISSVLSSEFPNFYIFLAFAYRVENTFYIKIIVINKISQITNKPFAQEIFIFIHEWFKVNKNKITNF